MSDLDLKALAIILDMGRRSAVRKGASDLAGILSDMTFAAVSLADPQSLKGKKEKEEDFNEIRNECGL